MKILKKFDIVIIIVLLLLSFIPYGAIMIFNSNGNSNGVYAKITVNGEEYKIVRLDTHSGVEKFNVKTSKGYNTIKVEDEKIAIIDADCNDKVCERVGYIYKVGQTAVCLPHKLIIEITGEVKETEEEDFIAR